MTSPTAAGSRLGWTVGVLRLTLSDPGEVYDRILGRARKRIGQDAVVSYQLEPAWEAWLHRQLGRPWPCPEQGEFGAVWEAATDTLRVRGLIVGRGSYGGWDDADSALARAAWCLTAHLLPGNVVETGVARGVTTRIILERLKRNGRGHLWSIDRPSPDKTIHDQIGAAVPDHLRDEWTLIAGTSRSRLRPLLSDLGQIDLFVHDSGHTRRNVSFELASAWPALGRGALLADDVNLSTAFRDFATAIPASDFAVANADDGRALFGIALKR